MLKVILLCGTVLFSQPAFAQDFESSDTYQSYLQLPNSMQTPDEYQLYKRGFEAKNTVRNLPCKSGGTIDQCLNNKAKVQAVDDLGWSARPYQSDFYIERTMVIGTMPIRYRWIVDQNGLAKPDNGHAIGISR